MASHLSTSISAIISAKWAMNHARSGIPNAATPPTEKIYRMRILFLYSEHTCSALSEAINWCNRWFIVNVPSGGRPRHGVKTWRSIAIRVLSETSAENWMIPSPQSEIGDGLIGGRLNRWERIVHMRVMITGEVEAVGYALWTGTIWETY